MADGSRVYAVAGDRIVRFTIDRAGAHDSHSTLEGADARCVAVDPRDPNRVYVGTFEDGLFCQRRWGRHVALGRAGTD